MLQLEKELKECRSVQNPKAKNKFDQNENVNNKKQLQASTKITTRHG